MKTDTQKKLLGTWQPLLEDEIQKEYILGISHFLKNRRNQVKVYPESEKVFRAFQACAYEDVKVVIIGQDPYHNGYADGLAFSSNSGDFVPASLVNIYTEIERSMYPGLRLSQPTDLTNWANQGVLLLNRTLTVEAGMPNSHEWIGWKTFTTEVVKRLSKAKEHLVFLLWGSKAADLMDEINNPDKHLILTSSHPSPLSYTSTSKPFKGNNHFAITTKYLTDNGLVPVFW